MIESFVILNYLKEKGYRFYSGVPCSILKEFMDAILKDKTVQYIPAVRENAALGVASGAYLAGKKSCVLMQNSGLGNIINALTSFSLIYRVPALIFMTWRGFEGRDAPEHIIMGEKMIPMLKELGMPYRVLTDNYKKDIDWALDKMDETGIPVALILKEGVIV